MLLDELRRSTRFRALRHVAECGSTQDLAASEGTSAAVAGVPSVVWADHQTAGRGRQGRSWSDDAGADLAVTFTLPGLQLRQPLWLAAAVPLAVLEALEPRAGTTLRLKWPNDLMLRGRKLAGILIDGPARRDGGWLVGIGVNVNRTRFPPELENAATSLALHTGRAVPVPELLLDVARCLDRVLAELEAGRIEWLQALFADRIGLLGRKVIVRTTRESTEGRLGRLDFEAAGLDGGREFPLGSLLALGPIS